MRCALLLFMRVPRGALPPQARLSFPGAASLADQTTPARMLYNSPREILNFFYHYVICHHDASYRLSFLLPGESDHQRLLSPAPSPAKAATRAGLAAAHHRRTSFASPHPSSFMCMYIFLIPFYSGKSTAFRRWNAPRTETCPSRRTKDEDLSGPPTHPAPDKALGSASRDAPERWLGNTVISGLPGVRTSGG